MTAVVTLGFCVCAIAGEGPKPPAIAQVVPVEDYVGLVASFRQHLREMLIDEQTFLDSSHKVSRDAQTLAAVALVLGLDEKDHPLNGAAPALLQAARQLAEAKHYAAAQEAMTALDRALDEQRTAAQPIKPEKVASLGQLMKQVSFAQNRLRRGARRIDDDKESKVRDAALLAAIAQATIYDDDRLDTPARREQWYRFCGQMRDSAGDLSRALRATDKEGTERALRELGRSCDVCHAAFR
ncbi:MAG TPA: hypothetical protein VHC22_02315 [Pirellulales bacterium]|nr:hypothetical protein [Pirellulales bacterium]